MERKFAGEIKHLFFLYQKGSGSEEFWKGVEFVKFHDDGRSEERICYWANRGRGKGWKWGQYAVFFPPGHFDDLAEYIRQHPDGDPARGGTVRGQNG